MSCKTEISCTSFLMYSEKKLAAAIKAAWFIIALSFAGCSNTSSPPKEDPSTEEEPVEELSSSSTSDSLDTLPRYEGFSLVEAKGKSVTLGTNSKDANADERPSMKVVFDYDFFVGQHEVTVGEYGKMMNKSVNKDSSDKPQVNVTFYDAVLYANALSKQYGLDTVYSYSGTNFDEEGSCDLLAGLKTDFSILGFRLPTEAEWIFTANEVSGSVKEWVNDWKGAFRDTTISNYVGAASANGMNEMVLKGSSFAMRDVPLYARGDFYTVTPLSKSDYVGFRLVLGKIENPVWLNSSGHATGHTITPLVQAENIHALLETYSAMLVFRNDETGNLAYINYSNAANTVIEINDGIDSYHPDISPDGKYVAFCTGLEGVAGTSSVYVRELNKSGSGLVKLDVDGAAIPRFRVTPSGDTVIVFVTNAGPNKSESTWGKYTTWTVPFKGGKFGTPQKLLNGSFHGGVSLQSGLAVTGAPLLRATRWSEDSQKNSLWYNGEQACNASLSIDGSDRTLFLDFGSSAGVHEIIQVVDSVGNLIQSVKSPKGYSFDHTEWASDKNIAVATLTNGNGAHQKIVAVNMESEKIVELAEGAELWHPCLWTKRKASVPSSSSATPTSSSAAEQSSSSFSSSSAVVESSSEIETSSSSAIAESSSATLISSSSAVIESSSEDIITSSNAVIESSSETETSSSSNHIISYDLDKDSAGIYLNSVYNVGYGIMRSNMELLWKYHDKANVVVLGSSRPLDGIIPKQFNEKFFVLNLAHTPNSIYSSKFYLDHYVYPHIKNLRYIILSIDYDLWRYGPTTDHNFFFSNYTKFPGYIYDKNHNYWADGIPENLAQVTEDGYKDVNTDGLIENMGFWSTETCNGWRNTCSNDSTILKGAILESAMNSLTELIQTADAQNLYVIGVIFPVSPQYKDSGRFACYGTRRSLADSLTNVLTEMQQQYPHFILMDENKMGDHDYTDAMAADNQHLCPVGAAQLTHRVDSLLLELEKP